ncbi:hypothetical protein HYT23_07075 [Candidatus Pacearchaeota archaeon]|nr:hypothetical protein [Candidatus Pacearchaeota archaeon]
MVFEDRYDDPVKQLSRIEQLKFEQQHLATVPPKKRKVVYLPGPMNREWEIYAKQGILPENATGLENDPECFEVLQQNSQGINTRFTNLEDYFEEQAKSTTPDLWILKDI